MRYTMCHLTDNNNYNYTNNLAKTCDQNKSAVLISILVLSPTLSFSYDTEKLQRRQKFFYKINAQFLKNQRTKNIICGKTHYLYNKKKKHQFITMLLNFTICLEMVISVFISYTIDRPINQFRSNISKERQSGFLEFHSAQY